VRQRRQRALAPLRRARARGALIDAIRAVKGIDAFFIGPSDLSQSMGLPATRKAPPVTKAIAHVGADHRPGRTPRMPATPENQGRGGGKWAQIRLYTSAASPERGCLPPFFGASLRLWPKTPRGHAEGP